MNKYFGKRVAVLGLGINGLDSVRYLSGQGAEITVLDKKNQDELAEDLKKLVGLEFKTILGASYLSSLEEFDFIFRSPGVRRNLPQILAVEEKGAVVTSPTMEFFSQSKAKIIGVTGTKGKGTTSTLIHLILRAAGKNSYLAGNIGVPMLELLSKLTPQDWVVLELSSFQLQDLTDSPHIAVITNITSDHMDYHLSQNEYISAKTNILKFQKETDFAVLNFDDPSSKNLWKQTLGKYYWFTTKGSSIEGCFVGDPYIFFSEVENDHPLDTIAKVSDIQLRGEHNLSNVLAAALAGFLAGVDISAISQVITSFTGLEHRLELVAKIKGVSYYNDSFGTTPDTAIAALKSFNEPIILIAGGSDKGSDYSALGKEIISRNVKTLILIGQMSQAILGSVRSAGKYNGTVIAGLKSMTEIIKCASSTASPGDIVLLSPACASFDMFSNYKDRGSQFKNSVKALENYA